MAQGNLKKKAAGIAKKAKTQRKSLAPKKGGRMIKPKNTTKSNVRTVKKRLEIQIKASIETQVVEQAKKFEHKPLTIVKKPSGKPRKRKNKGAGSKKKVKSASAKPSIMCSLQV